jgi:serine/threonine protein kinase
VLDAVAHAHANLIVHRDLKPSNVLVRTDGQVKLLDFGIAKLLENESGVDATALTREGGVLLTPAYAAPEQMMGGLVTTATDVYALGVLLHVLLAGRHPAGEALRSPAELLKAILETEPARVSTIAAAPLARALRGDLDTIVAKALKKNPEERYASVVALADDLRRYLDHQPIAARRIRRPTAPRASSAGTACRSPGRVRAGRAGGGTGRHHVAGPRGAAARSRDHTAPSARRMNEVRPSCSARSSPTAAPSA